MLVRVADPAILPSHVARCSVAVDLHDEATDLDATFAGIELPARLRDAARKRHIEFLAGRWCVREALRAQLPERAGITVGHDDSRAPVWPDGLVGSITHTQNFVSSAVAPSEAVRSLGIDSEVRFSVERARRLGGHFARPRELADLARAGLDEGDLATLVFSLKESVFKCLHPFVRGYFGFQVAHVVEVSAREGRARVRLVEGLTREFHAGCELEGRFDLGGDHLHTALVIDG